MVFWKGFRTCIWERVSPLELMWSSSSKCRMGLEEMTSCTMLFCSTKCTIMTQVEFQQVVFRLVLPISQQMGRLDSAQEVARCWLVSNTAYISRVAVFQVALTALLSPKASFIIR